ncbi:hypothetical protein C7T94_18240 [Pedobacter yulinensis]|uniref:Beta-lactamase-related domain-containing protein n=1 Tax=Pedobacter yulinensis TaxID=2126353 RepID=A0A2T3HH92_9SPHI|nr:serine hydrolase domain-containing protein [Pedobacter yulinensis]PST81809.1 hypothetical protein C7T94_18240 [Pedobacter yulinensis]
MSGKYLIAVLLGFLLCGTTASAQTVLADSTTAKLNEAVAGFQNRYHAPGLVLVIVYKDNVLFAGASGYTDLESKTPATIDSKFQLQSLSKLFTATLAMKLWERGVIGLDTDIRKLVPEFRGQNRGRPASGTMMIELLTHSSGLPRNAAADVTFARQIQQWQLNGKLNGPVQAATLAAFLKSLGTASREHPEFDLLPPDSRQYSNMGYTLLGIGLGRAAKTTFEAAVIKGICQPLGMPATGFGTMSHAMNTIATGYSYREETQSFVRTPGFKVNASAPAGGMFSTGRDMARFISAQFSEDKAVLSPKTIRMMHALGIGWQRSYPFVKHEGAMLGARTEIVIHPKAKLGWVVLTNATDFEFGRLNEYIAGLLLPLFAEQPVTNIDAYAGTYYLEGSNETLRIYKQDGRLFSTYLEDLLPQEPLVFSGSNALKARGHNGHDVTYQFLAAGGKVLSLRLDQLTWIKK